MWINYRFGSVYNSLIATLRPVGVWGIELAAFYSSPGSQLQETGSGWAMPWSLLQLAGMLALFLGTAVFNENVKLRACFRYDGGGQGEISDCTDSDSDSGGGDGGGGDDGGYGYAPLRDDADGKHGGGGGGGGGTRPARLDAERRGRGRSSDTSEIDVGQLHGGLQSAHMKPVARSGS
jgi:hypothetical protein